MRSIKPRGNRSTELCLAIALRKAGLTGWRRHLQVRGRPDFTFKKQLVVVFVDGDFWHGNPRNFKLPKTNCEFWMKKIEYNRAKDRRVTKFWRDRGWTVIRIWESTLKRSPDACLNRVVRALEKIRA
jgi:DNA mismatch endonuclease (patch repair protein)